MKVSLSSVVEQIKVVSIGKRISSILEKDVMKVSLKKVLSMGKHISALTEKRYSKPISPVWLIDFFLKS